MADTHKLEYLVAAACRFNCDAESSCDCLPHRAYREIVAEQAQEIARLTAQTADCHGVIASLWALTDPDTAPPDLIADIETILGADREACGNSTA